LRELDITDQAWLEGRITREHVRVLGAAANPRIRAQIAQIQAELIGISEDRTFHHWRLRVAEAVSRLDLDGPDPDDPTHTSATWARSGLFAQLRATCAGADVEAVGCARRRSSPAGIARPDPSRRNGRIRCPQPAASAWITISRSRRRAGATKRARLLVSTRNCHWPVSNASHAA
jgi:hypothetical protein